MDEKNIPIEIAIPKFLEWLESRKIIPKNWQPALKNIRTKIAAALNDMPEHVQLVQLLNNSYIDYFHCLQVVDILKETEKDTKSLFGRYGSQRMNDWLQILNEYKKDNLYLAEAGQIIQRILYEVPALRRHRNKSTQQIQEANHRIKELCKNEELLLSEHGAFCKQLGIKGHNLRQEFLERVQELPSLYKELAAKVPALTKAQEYYAQLSGQLDLLPVLQHIAKHGNTTVYEYTRKEAPSSVDEPVLHIQITDIQSSANDEIDFGGDDDINFEIVDEEAVTDSTDIDWGQIEVVPEAGSDFELTVEDSGIQLANSGAADDTVARGYLAYSLLDSPSLRDQFVDELYELEAFLKMRKYEFESIDVSKQFVFNLIDGNQLFDSSSLADMLIGVQSVQKLCENEALGHLHRLKHSANYADILASKLKQKIIGIDKSKASRQLLGHKIETYKLELEKAKIEIEQMGVTTKDIVTKIESDLSQRYNGRVVTLYGGMKFEMD